MIRLAAVLFLLAVPAFGDSALAWTVRPGVDLPLGDSQTWAGTSLGIENGVTWKVPGTDLCLAGMTQADWIPLKSGGNVLLFSVYPGVEYWFRGANPRISIGISGLAGVTYGARSTFNESAVEPFLAVGNTIRFRLEPTLNFDTVLRVEFVPGLWQGLGFWVGFTQAVGG